MPGLIALAFLKELYMIEIFKYKGYTVEVDYAQDPENPRTFDNIGTILYTSKKYELGDRYSNQDEIDDIKKRDDIISSTVYAMIHSDIYLSLDDFKDPLDSVESGIIYCELEKAKKEFPNLEGNELIIAIQNQFKFELEIFSKYINGSVYEYHITEPNNINEYWGTEYEVDNCFAPATLWIDQNPLLDKCVTFTGKDVCEGIGTVNCERK